MLEEIEFNYKITKVNINKDEQFKTEFKKISPFSKIPVIKDHEKNISVNPNNFETNKKGIFAVGDICTYPGKLKLILSGFHEVALASVECFKRARPNEQYKFEFTTSSKTIKDRLGKK